jgi:diacylglycerol kinase family enzyme
MSAGVRAGAGAIARFHPFATSVAGPVGRETLELAQVFVANLPLYEFGLHVAPDADPTDSTLDVVGFAADSRLAVLRMLVDLHRGKHLRHKGVHRWRAPAVSLLTDGASPIVADSTDLGTGPVRLRALPGVLQLVRP